MIEKQCGRLANTPIATLAARCADVVALLDMPHAVTMDPEGRVWVEAPHEAAEVDIVGTYQRALGVLELTRLIAGDLRHEAEMRGLRRASR